MCVWKQSWVFLQVRPNPCTRKVKQVPDTSLQHPPSQAQPCCFSVPCWTWTPPACHKSAPLGWSQWLSADLRGGMCPSTQGPCGTPLWWSPGHRAALGQRWLPAPQWGTSCGCLWSVKRPPTLTPAWGFAPFQAQNSPSTGAGQGLHFPSAGGSWGTSQANPARYLQRALASKSPWFSCSNPSWQMPKLLESPELVKLNTWKRDAGWQPLKFLTKTSK